MIASETTAIDIFEYANKASILVVLIFIIYSGYKKWWVFGWQYKEMVQAFLEMREEKNAWRETALKGKDIAIDAFKELRDRRR